MSAGHTPAPWVVRSTGNVGSKDGLLVAVVYPCEFEDFEANPANARLIAAAPELLEFAQRYLESWGDLEGWLQNQAREVIAKATGSEA